MSQESYNKQEPSELEKFIDKIKNSDKKLNKAYDYIAKNYWKMSKEELKTICLEIIYEVDKSILSHKDFDMNNVIEEIAETNIY